MLTSNFTAGFGNHMWKYAITRAVAELNGYQWGFNPIPEYDNGRYNGVPQFGFMDIDYGITHTYRQDTLPRFVKYIWSEKVEERRYLNGDYVRFFPYQPEVFDVMDNTKLHISCCQDARYLEPIKDRVKSWFSIKEEYVYKYQRVLDDLEISLEENTAVLHVRGGDYLGDPRILLPLKYWTDAMKIMKNRNANMSFICITDDVPYATSLFHGEIPVYQNELGCDYYIINNAKNLILSASSFSMFPTWLSDQNPYAIAPRYWWRYNLSDGYWCSSDVWTFKWNFLDRNGMLYEK